MTVVLGGCERLRSFGVLRTPQDDKVFTVCDEFKSAGRMPTLPLKTQ